jgi:hypothetical protein
VAGSGLGEAKKLRAPAAFGSLTAEGTEALSDVPEQAQKVTTAAPATAATAREGNRI